MLALTGNLTTPQLLTYLHSPLKVPVTHIAMNLKEMLRFISTINNSSKQQTTCQQNAQTQLATEDRKQTVNSSQRKSCDELTVWRVDGHA